MLAWLPATVTVWDNGLARTPPRGFATWNIWPFTSEKNRSCSPPTCVPEQWIMRSVNESQCQHWAQALVDADLVGEGGFSYFVVQEPCFGPRDPLTGELTETGEYRERWPHGMAAFGRFLKERGMKLGIYTDIGDLTCGGCVGSGSGPTGHVAIDMETFARWGADFIEVDACGGPVDEETWREYRDAINATGRPMVHSVCAEGYAEPWTWGNGVGNMWRVNGDIADGWLNIIQGLNGANAIPQLARYAGPGGWNDMDMLEIGALPSNFSWGGPGLTLAEARSHFTLWSVLKSPLLLGADASRMSAEILQIVKNKELRRIHEDPLGLQAEPLDDFYPGYHAETATVSVLRPCVPSDPQQLWGSSYEGRVSMPVVGVTTPPFPRVRNAGSVTHCLSVLSCEPSATSPLIIRQCDDWSKDPCVIGDVPFPTQVFTPAAPTHRPTDSPWALVANVTQNNSDPAAPLLCLTAPSSGDVPLLDRCDRVPGAVPSDRQGWWWEIDPATPGDAHPKHPGTLIRSVSQKGMCLSTNFTAAQTNEVYAAGLEGGGWAIALFNRAPLPQTLSVQLSRLRPAPSCGWIAHDIWGGRNLTGLGMNATISQTVAPHDVALFRLEPDRACAPAA
jgi:alpha-galactosidase